ncbi:beta galactosidase jelly roll domain-containing protein [Maribacter halichondriae]|uniref:beta galactosidase jelly roll domain-containing protein n=1 Tax=Maribacter halichondriae TaxID=2980554 RepID=UPI0023583A39|nr:beta galactosidase jelly roll domain-containing protein [Maribacter sp. Hal144]
MSRKKLVALDEFNKELETIKEENIAVYKDWYSKFPTEAIPRSPEEWETMQLDDDGYAQPDFDTSRWGNTEMPNVVEKLSTTSNDGIFWFRKTFDLDEISSDYTFVVSEGIDDMDFLFVNGKKLGSTFGWNTPRAYTIPKSSLVEGQNTIAIRVIDTGGGGGFSGNVTLTANSSGESIPINENWQYKQIAGIQGFNFLLFHKNTDALDNPPDGIESFNLDANTPTVLFNGMIHPLIPYTIQGAIWYQGESNVGRHEQYLKLFPGMIDDWRERWNSDFSFYFVQIAPFEYGGGLSPALRDAQRKSLKTTKTGMAITIDIGMKESIHPGNKQEVGDRLARLALANDYGKNIVASGPLYKSHSTKENKIVVEFENLGEGLTTDDSDLEGFEIAAADKNFLPATAIIVDGKIEVSSPSIKKPHYVRYGWKDYLEGSLFNSDKLPASSFTTE